MAKMTPANRDYIDGLTFEDAVRAFENGEWDVAPRNVIEYTRFDTETARNLKRAKPAVKAAYVDAIIAYLLQGKVPTEDDYDSMPGQAAGPAFHAIDAQERELKKRYLAAYKRHISGKLTGKDKTD